MSDSENPSNPPLSYKDAGVDIDAGNALIERIKGVAKSTRRPEVLAGLGGFGALCALPKQYHEPILVSGADGVGTKLRLAIDLNAHQGVGIDLVAMCVNDLIVQGAEPLFFLDYYATGHLDIESAASVIEGIGQGCNAAGCALIGGETAEMPGMYQQQDYDLAGFCVGVVEKADIIDGSQVRARDVLIGLASSGAHSNGYSLIRKVIERSGADLHAPITFDGQVTTLAKALLEPTRIYVAPILSLMKVTPIHALSHITGGGLLENIPRALPNNCRAVIKRSNWPCPELFNWLQDEGNIIDAEMTRTFNCGIGMVLSVSPEHAEIALQHLNDQGEQAYLIGHIEARKGSDSAIEIC